MSARSALLTLARRTAAAPQRAAGRSRSMSVQGSALNEVEHEIAGSSHSMASAQTELEHDIGASAGGARLGPPQSVGGFCLCRARARGVRRGTAGESRRLSRGARAVWTEAEASPLKSQALAAV